MVPDVRGSNSNRALCVDLELQRYRNSNPRAGMVLVRSGGIGIGPRPGRGFATDEK
jgi:hypothetical protein